MDASEINYRVGLGRSRVAGAFVLSAGMATLALACCVPFASWAKAAIVVCCGVTMLDAYRAVALRVGRGGVRSLAIRGDVIEVCDGCGLACVGQLRHGAFVAPWLTILRWRPASARLDRTIVILSDMLEPAAFRELRVLLRWR